MGTIQEALKELRKTRVAENKTTRKSRSLKESNTKKVRVKKPVKESIMWNFDICNEGNSESYWLKEDGEDYNPSFEEYAEERLSRNARCKENWMDPSEAGKGHMNHGECDIMWVTQGDFTYSDFETLIECFGEYYKEETNGKTYTVVMKCRSYPGYGNYVKRVVSFKDGNYYIEDEEAQVLDDGDLDLYIRDGEFFLYCEATDISGYGETIWEVKQSVIDCLEDLNRFAETTDGYEVSDNEVKLDGNFPDEMTVEDYLQSVGKTEVSKDEPIGQGKYYTYEELEESLKEDVNPKFVDMDGDVEVADFNLSSFNESLNEAFNTSDIKKDPRFANLSDKLIRALIRIMEDDAFGDVEPTSEMFLQWIDDACNGGPLTPIALEVGAQLSSNDFYELIKNDPKFMDAFIKVCRKINWTDREGNALDSENKPLKRTSRYELVTDFLNMADNKQDAIDILSNAYYKDDYSSLQSRAKGLNEDLASSLPVHALPENEVVDYINNIPVAKGIERAEDGTVIAKARPTCFFKLGYFKQVEVASKFRGGRGSKPEDPIVKIFKAIEYSKLYTGADYENLKAVKQFRKETGTERSGEKTGFAYQGEGTTVNKIGSYANGDKALQSYLANNCKTKTKYYISINDGDVQEATRQEVAQYLTPANANKLLNPEARPKTVEKSVNAESGEEIVTFNPQAVNRLKIANIYMIGNLGHSIM